MKRIRIKKEIALVWAVTTNGHEEPLEGRNLSLFLVDPKYRKTAKTFHIENGNEVHFRVYPSEQPFTGVYTLELWENLGGQDQTVVDKRSAFELVNFTPQECDGSVDDIHAAEVFIGAGNLAVGIHGRGIVSVTKVSEDPNDWDYRILYDDGATEIIQIARGEKGLTDEEHAELIAETLAAKSAAQSANLAATLAASKAAEAAEAAQTATNAAEAANAAKEAADAATEAAQEATAAANAAKTAANNAATLANNAAANANTKAALAQAAADATNAAIAAASTATAAANAATAAANTAAEAANTAASTANSAASNASAKATLANNAATAANAAKDAANSAASAANAAAALANDAAARAEAAILTIENKIERVELVCEDDQHITRKGSSVALTYDEVKALVDEPKNFVTLRYLDMFWMLPSYDDGGAIMFTSSGIEFGHVVVTRVILNTDGQMNNYSIIAEDADHKTDDMSKETAMDGHMTYPTTHAVNLKLDDLQSQITELDKTVNGNETTAELPMSNYLDGTFSIANGGGSVGLAFFDKRCVCDAANKISKVSVLVTTAQTLTFHFVKVSDNNIVASVQKTAVVGRNDFDISIADSLYTEQLYVAIETEQGKYIRMASLTNTGNYGYINVSTKAVTYNKYATAYSIFVVSSTSNGLKQLGYVDDIADAIAEGKNDIALAPKDYIITSPISVPSKTSIHGSFGKTRILLSSGCTTAFTSSNAADIKISDLEIVGTEAEYATAMNGIVEGPGYSIITQLSDVSVSYPSGTQGPTVHSTPTISTLGNEMGVYLYKCENVVLQNLKINHINGSAIRVNNVGKNYEKGLVADNLFITNCVNGIMCEDEHEFSQYTNFRISKCQVGLVIASGNLSFSNGSITKGIVGIALLDGYNQGHGVLDCIQIKHNQLAGFYAKDIVYGELIGTLFMQYSKAEIVNSKAIMIGNLHCSNSTITCTNDAGVVGSNFIANLMATTPIPSPSGNLTFGNLIRANG